jgi:hypothetical protein
MNLGMQEPVRGDGRTILRRREAERAIYIDFEGRQDGPPSLLGILYATDATERSGDVFEQHVLERLFWRAAEERYLSTRRNTWPILATTLGRSVATLSEQLESEDRLLVAWSKHELDVIEADKETQAHLEVIRRRYRDGKEVAKQWKRLAFPDLVFERDRRRGRNRLEQFLELIGYPVSSSHGAGNTGQRIRHLREGLSRCDGDFTRLTRTVKSKWTNLLEHNRHDCVGMRAVVLRAATELEQSTR